VTIQLPAYPGRGVAVHRHHDGHLEWIYFLTGRSEASRRRVLHAADDRLLVLPADELDHPDPLRHYACIRLVDARLVIGNGDHVDQISDALASGRRVDDALRDLEPEPDPPIHTPRIAVVAPSTARNEAVDVVATWQDDGSTYRQATAVDLAPGSGVLVHTYGGSVDEVTSDAQPHRFDGGPPGTDVAGRLWHALDPGLRVALAVGLVPSPVPTRVLTERRP
jgi:IMP cyclohydrolase